MQPPTACFLACSANFLTAPEEQADHQLLKSRVICVIFHEAFALDRLSCNGWS